MYKVFTRTWWRINPEWPNGLEPHAGRKRTIAKVSTEEEAQQICSDWNESHHAGKLSRKAEYQEA